MPRTEDDQSLYELAFARYPYFSVQAADVLRHFPEEEFFFGFALYVAEHQLTHPVCNHCTWPIVNEDDHAECPILDCSSCIDIDDPLDFLGHAVTDGQRELIPA